MIFFLWTYICAGVRALEILTTSTSVSQLKKTIIILGLALNYFAAMYSFWLCVQILIIYACITWRQMLAEGVIISKQFRRSVELEAH